MSAGDPICHICGGYLLLHIAPCQAPNPQYLMNNLDAAEVAAKYEALKALVIKHLDEGGAINKALSLFHESGCCPRCDGRGSSGGILECDPCTCTEPQYCDYDSYEEYLGELEHHIQLWSAACKAETELLHAVGGKHFIPALLSNEHWEQVADNKLGYHLGDGRWLYREKDEKS